MNIAELKVGLIGGTGEEGRGVALRWALAGAEVVIGSRTIERAQAAAEELNRILGGARVGYALNETVAARSDFVMLTVPFEHAAATLDGLHGDIRADAIVIDITVPVSFEKGRARYLELPEGSGSEHLRAHLPEGVALVAAFKTEPAHLLADNGAPLLCDSFVASDSKGARERVIEAMRCIEGLRPVDAGLLESARTLERMTVLAIGINRRYKVKTARYRVVGLEA